MQPHTLSPALQSETVSLLTEHPPYHLGKMLRIVYFEYLHSISQVGIPPEHSKEIIMMDALLHWLDSAVEETREWNLGERQFYEEL